MPANYKGPTRGYTLTDDDILWLARGFVGEAGEAAGACSREEARWLFWTWMNRFLLMPNAAWSKGKFSDLIRAHSQALSPLWDEPSDPKCLQYPDRCGPAEIARRARIRSKTKAQLEAAGVWQFAVDAQDGSLSRPMGAAKVYDFEACFQTKKGVNVGGNCFYRFDELPAWQKPLVATGQTVQVWPTPSSLLRTAALATAGILLGYGAWTVWSGRRRRK